MSRGIAIPVPTWLLRPILRVRSWMIAREIRRVVERAREDALADVARLTPEELRESLLPGRASRGWDGRAHLATVATRQHSRYRRTYYVTSRDIALVRLGD